MTVVKSVDIADDVMAVLTSSKVTDGGKLLTLPPGQLERKLYERVAKVLTAIGGKWNRHKGGFVFIEDVRPEFKSAKQDGKVIDEKRTFQAFYTPFDLCERMVKLAKIKRGDRVLEPSAGDGRLAIAAARAGGKVTAVEVRPQEAAKIQRTAPENVEVSNADFLVCRPVPIFSNFDAIVMNPPFTKQQDVEHVMHAIKFLRRVPRGDVGGGIIVAIMGAGFVTSKTKKAQALRDVLAGFSTVHFHDLPEGTFKESGTNVRTVMLEAW